VTFRVFRASGCALIFVDQAFADGFSADLLCVDLGYGRGVSIAFVGGDALGDALMRPGRVVMRPVVGQDGAQVCLAENQHAVGSSRPQGADEALAGRVIRGAWTAVRRTLVPAA
jgi:hypothetical protein